MTEGPAAVLGATLCRMRSIRFRLLLGFGILLAADLAGYGLLFHTVVEGWLTPDVVAMAKDKSLVLGRWIPAGPLAADENLPARILNEPQGYAWAVLDATGRPVQQSRLLPTPFPVPPGVTPEPAKVFDPPAQILNSPDGGRYAVAWCPLFEPRVGGGEELRGWTEAVVPLKPLLERQDRLGRWLLAAGVVGLLAFSGLAFHLCGLWLRPWRSTADAARRLAQGDLAEGRLPDALDDADLARVVESFNGLLDRLKSAHQRQHQFVADASHELRTPLAALRAEIEIALRRERTGGEYQQTLQLNRLELERLGTLVENLLTLAQLDAVEAPTRRAPSDLAALCREVTEQFAPQAGARGLRLTLDVPDQLILYADASTLGSALRNLVDNALKHTPAGEKITVKLDAADGGVRLSVMDHGLGIAPEHLPRLFDRFYRVDSARNRALGGAGLGLSIVKAAAKAHGGTVSVRSELGKGSTFTIHLPGVSASG